MEDDPPIARGGHEGPHTGYQAAEIADAASRLSDAASGADGRRELWLFGDASQRCRAELEALGWTLETSVGTALYEAVPPPAEGSGEG